MKKISLLILATFIGVWSINAQKPISQANWTLVSVDSEETVGEDGAAINAFDGDVSTFWHTDWATTGDPYPHEIVIDLGASYDMIGFQFTPRSGNSAGVPDTFAFYTSVDNVTWDLEVGGLWDTPYDVVRTEAFTKTGQYIKFVGESGQGDYLHTHCAELDILVLGADFTADKTIIMRGESVSFTDKSGNTPVAWKWAFEGGTPATSTDQNPVVSYTDAGVYEVQLISIPDAGDPTQNDTTTLANYITVDIPNVSRDDWTVAFVDSYQPGAEAEHVFDGDDGTLWHTEWGETGPLPHHLIIDMGASYETEGFAYTPRDGGGNGVIGDYEFYVCNDPDPAEWGTPVSSGTWTSWSGVINEFYTPKIGRYIVLMALSEGHGSLYFTTCAELNVKGSLFGAAFTADKTEIYASQSVNFTDVSAGATAWTWAFDGGTPAVSSDQNPSVKYDAGGLFDVQLVMTPQSGAANNDTLLKAGYINVKSTPSTKYLENDTWTILSVDSEEPGREVENILDGDLETFWHTGWSQVDPDDPYPHEILIDMGANYNLVGFEYSPRSGGGNGTVSEYELSTSVDAELFDVVSSGTWLDDWASTRVEMFDASKTGRFVKFTALSEKAGNPWAACAELNMLVEIEGVEFGFSETFVEKAGTIDFVDFSAGDPTAWSWTFEGGTPSSSTEQSPAGIVYNDFGIFDVTLTTTGGTAPGTLTKTDLVTVNYILPSIGTGVHIDTLEFGNAMVNYSGADGGYVDYTDTPFDVYRGESYSLKVTHIDPWDAVPARYQYVWIDWNSDGTFGATELILNTQDIVDVVIPVDAALGETRMRVVGRYYDGSDDPYKKIDYGEMEDYTVVIGELSASVPVADFSSDVSISCAGEAVSYTDISTNTPTTWAWTFEGGTPATSNLKNPVVVYADAGVYDVSLTASQTSGSDDEAKTDMITVNGLPTVAGGDDVAACFGEEITLSGSGADSYVWDNDVVDGVAFVPSNMSYAVTGTDANSCSNTDTVTVTVEAKIDFTVTEGTNTLTVDAAGATFQWIDCADNSDIDGETAGQFVATVTGNYAVVVTLGSCSTTSDCYNVDLTGIGNNFGNEISVYPNPSSGMFNIAIDRDNATIKVYNTLGALVLIKEKTSSIEQFELTTKGLYIIQIESRGDIYTGKLVVE